MSEELHRKYRPKTFKEVAGQTKAVALLSRFVKTGKVPHTILFTGPSGCGKTTLARVLKSKLNCSPRDFTELNCADVRGIDEVRKIRSQVNHLPMGGDCRVWLIDEAHKLTNDAQNAFLKTLEEPPPHVYFFLATTDPGKLLKTVQTRCTEVHVDLCADDVLRSLIVDVANKEGGKLTKDVVDKLVESSQGSARKALVILNQIIGVEDEDEQLAAILAADANNQAIMIARALMKAGTTWADMVKILKGVDEDPESLRRMILSYSASCLQNPNKAMQTRAFLMLTAFSQNYFDMGRPGLLASCYEVLTRK